MKESVLAKKSFAFALRVVKMYKHLCAEKKEYILSGQIMRSGTSIGASIKEAQYAQSTPDFIHKLSIAVKEANETEYWLELLKETSYLEAQSSDSMIADCRELLRLLTSSIKTAKRNKQ